MVVCSEVIEHVFSPQEVLDDIVNHVKPGGCVIVSVPNAFHIKHRLYYLFGEHLDPNKDPVRKRFPEHIQAFSFGHMEQLLAISGLRVLSSYGYFKPLGRLIKNSLLRSLFSSYILIIAQKPNGLGSLDSPDHV